MAPLNDWLWRPGTPVDNRGQFLLVGAFGIAVILLVFAGVLNTVTFTESLATQDGDHATSRDVSAFQEDVRRGTTGILERVNTGTGDYSTKEARFTDSVGNWSGGTDQEHVSDVTSVAVTVSGTSEGSRITQSTVRTLTNASGKDDWTLAQSVPDTRRFLLRLNESSLDLGSCVTGTCYELVVDDGTEWRVAVNQSAVTVFGPSSSGQCAIQDDPVTINVTGGTVDGQDCEALTFAEGVSDPYDIRYENGINATGTYRLIVNTTVNEMDYTDSGSPSVSPAIYAAVLQIRYRNPQLTYENQIRIAGGEPDA